MRADQRGITPIGPLYAPLPGFAGLPDVVARQELDEHVEALHNTLHTPRYPSSACVRCAMLLTVEEATCAGGC